MSTTTKIETSTQQEVEMILGHVFLNGAHMSVHAFAIDGLLIDTGSETLLEDFKKWFVKQKISKVVLTHNHEDHTAGAAWLQENLHKDIYIHEDSVEICRGYEQTPLYRQAIWGIRHPFEATALPKHFKSDHYQWETIATPGHTKDHLSFYCKDLKILFTGDLFVTPSPKVILDTENVHDTINSLKRVLTYDFEKMFCCHAGYIANGREMIMKKIMFLENIKSQCNKLSDAGENIARITEELFPKRYPIEQVSQHQWGSQHIVSSLLKDQATLV
ncbi:MBL fold metallo-hydrolase [Kurthia sibirica]|uniref:MBL fold metallo-hydrolase n=1 Tax=Kurthia sibirica TaxID=202750 RepID=A0A2U3AN49_9BACL|nr:MBL fold metallo-hydrolase [Kurthia sibirica]PWI25945.1 MBL fold metallo-hydrolase [Kurthia sibirica]GEK35149.1 hypothetical protein KSI01_26820 [Kurthia sibirica]